MGWEGNAYCNNCGYNGYMYGECPICQSKNTSNYKEGNFVIFIIFLILCGILIKICFN